MIWKWQPIETAPKDGRLLLTDGQEIAIGFWDNLWWANECNRYGGDGGSTYPIMWTDPAPTHWMPLPEIKPEDLQCVLSA